MAKTQYTYIERKHSESGQTGTATYDLPEKGFLPEVIVKAYSTPTASTNPALPLSDAITKIEIIDGGTVIQSLTGNQVKGLSMIRKYKTLGGLEINDNGAEGYDDFHILLGGVIDGKWYAPDMSTFSNPQIRITWDYSQTTTEFGMSCDADTSPAMKFSVIGKILREPGPYTHGYIKSSVLKEFTQATSTTTVTEIPRGQMLLGLGVEAGYDAKDFTDDVNQIKLDFDNGDWVPFEFYQEEIITSQQAWFGGPFEYSWIADAIDDKEFDSHMGFLNFIVCMASSNAGRGFEWQAIRKGVETLGMWDLATPSTISSYESVYFKSVGYAPFHIWYCPMKAILGDEASLIDTTEFSRIELETTSSSNASTSSTPDIIAEYLVT